MTRELIHHYTSIDTLEIILTNRTIRFNRLDRLDDVSEGSAFTNLKLEQFFFVSCWTSDSEESIPQWSMYTKDMAGVRITMPKEMFKMQALEVPGASGTGMPSLLPFSKIFGENYMVLPMFLDREHFEKDVEYVPDFMEQKNRAIQVQVTSEGEFSAQISDPTKIAALKNPSWSFQKEFRFVLFIVPAPSLVKDAGFLKNLGEHLPNIAARALHEGKGPDLHYFDVDISQAAIDNIKITLGPCCNDSDKDRVEKLLAKHSTAPALIHSSLTGTIRTPKRA